MDSVTTDETGDSVDDRATEQGCLLSLKERKARLARKLNSLEKRKELFSRIERAG